MVGGIKEKQQKGGQERGRERKKKQRIKYREIKIESVDGEVRSGKGDFESRMKRLEYRDKKIR